MNLKNAIKQLNEDYLIKTNLPDWFAPAFKTLLSRNITITSWNDLVRNLQSVVSDTKSVQDFVNRLSDNLEGGDLSKLLESIVEEPIDANYKYVTFNYVNGTSDKVQVPSNRFVDAVDAFIKQNLGSGLDQIVVESELQKALEDTIARVTRVHIVTWEEDD